MIKPKKTSISSETALAFAIAADKNENHEA